MNEIYYPQEPTEAEKYITATTELPLEANLDDVYNVIAHDGDSQIGHDAQQSLVTTHADMLGLLYAVVQENGLDISSETEDAAKAQLLLGELLRTSQFIANRLQSNNEYSVVRPEVAEDMQKNLQSILMNILQQSGRVDIQPQDITPLSAMLHYQTLTAFDAVKIALQQPNLEGREVKVSPVMERLQQSIRSRMITPQT